MLWTDWTRSDVIALGSLVISAVALRFAYVAARASERQAEVAEAARQDEIAAKAPSIRATDIRYMTARPGWFHLDLRVENRRDRPIELRQITCPRGIVAAFGQDVFKRQKDVNAPLVMADPLPRFRKTLLVEQRLAAHRDVQTDRAYWMTVTIVVAPVSGWLGKLMRLGQRRDQMNFAILTVDSITAQQTWTAIDVATKADM